MTRTPIIRQLPPHVVNQIAAGEVIERPASVVKELLENSVDAGATRIDVSIEKGGSEVIRIVDNGCGISADQITLAVSSHATSKISSAEDLFSVGSYGFRGEALASISAVSRFLIRSRTTDSDVGSELEIVGGTHNEIAPCGCPIGTSIEVRSLFFNTPVRRKFLRTTQTEMSHITEAFTRTALANPDIQFVLKHNEKTLHDLPATTNSAERIAHFFGEDLANDLITVESENSNVRLYGYVAHPTHSRSNQRWQYLFLNGRSIRDRSLQHALSESYRGLLLTGRFPICFLNITMPADAVDVNVHPTKQEVRFENSGQLYSQLLGMLRTEFLTSNLKSKASITVESAEDEVNLASQARSELVDWAKGQLGGGTAGGTNSSQTSIPWRSDMPSNPAAGGRSSLSNRESLVLNRMTSVPDYKPSPFGSKQSHQAAPSANVEDSESEIEPFQSSAKAIQIHNRYLVTETPEGVEIIDQHALHERILYEQLREKINAGALESQRLLVPEPVDLAPAERAAVLESRELLQGLGVDIEPFGGETILISSYPAMLANLAPADVVRNIIEQLIVDGKKLERRDLLDNLLHMIACKAAVKYGDPLTPEEINALLAQRSDIQDHHHCPHGRPSALTFTREDLDRQFKRI